MSWGRRDFIRRFSAMFGGSVAAAIPGIGAAVPTAAASAKIAENSGIFAEDVGRMKFDLVVVGGGIAGTTAAISAARHGVKVALVHERSMLGGNSSSEVKLYPENNSGHQPWIKESGIHDEFHVEERVRNHIPYREGTMNCHWDLVLYEWAVREPNLTLLLNTHVHRVRMLDAKTIQSVYCIQLGTEKSLLLEARLFVDATGDGVLAYRAGAEFRWGRESRREYGEALAPAEPNEEVMGNTLFFRAADTGAPVPFKRPEWAVEFADEQSLPGRNHGYIEGGYWWIEIGAPFHPTRDNNQIVHEGLRQLLGVWDHIKNKGDHGAANYGLEFVGFWPYKRECRRILGDFVLTQQHVQDPQSLPDAVAYGPWGIDIHVQGGILNRREEPYPPPGRDENWEALGTMPYGIPLRALYSRNIENLMMAGRPISGSYIAFASSRVLSTGCIVGQAVGLAAALCRKYQTQPREVAQKHAPECQQILLREDAFIPGVVNEDPDDLARHARASASSSVILEFPPGNESVEMRMPLAQIFPVSLRRLDRVELLLESKVSQDVNVRLGLRDAPHVWDFRQTKDLGDANAVVPAGHRGWVVFDIKTAVRPERLYYVYTSAHEGVFWQMFRETDEDLANRCPVGVAPASRPGPARWRPFTGGRSFCMRLTPEMAPFASQNVVRGTSRPDQWTNIWISDTRQGLPAWLQLEWPRPIAFNTVQVTFDTNANRRVVLPLFRYPECVRDYRLECKRGGRWEVIVETKDNYFRRRVHTFARVKSNALRLEIEHTNGVPSARVYEMRVYNEDSRQNA
ncbi:MAG: FAD-dependent oxidoreductase [Candidatus Hydrogenedentes bacterium]|nr:FAD-dependent oxidoreductase [Candidatus Hydrogenedentota bacterium]